ncbi:hypothetical protein B0H16DRAFT_994890 [Mycena metata]|uniref:Uncharacterized protein n=1 Tax=Mycena metata TaxID=1033252 RepID=A0AAD7N4L2_9AGAR|nr:hypothetical protein B0H16DRAFT_994890 [Mycena metata]
MASITSIPMVIRHHLLSMLPNFLDLGAMILTHRSFHDAYKVRRNSLLNEVARNLLGCMFHEALLLARAQEVAYQLGDGSVAFSTNRVFLLVNNDYIVNSLEMVMFALLKRDTKRFNIYSQESLGRFATKPFTVEASFLESVRFQAAAYRFWRFCLQPKKKRTTFLKALAPAELLELNHFVTGMSNLIYAIRGQPHRLESKEDCIFTDSVLSSGPENVFLLWSARQNKHPDFTTELEVAGSYDEEGFFRYSFIDAKKSKRLDDIEGLDSLQPIFDDDNRTMKELLRGICWMK